VVRSAELLAQMRAAFDSGSVILRRAGERVQLIVYLPAGLPPVELERSYRAALRCLERIALNLKETDPGLCATIGEHVARLGTVTQQAWSAASGMRERGGLGSPDEGRRRSASVVLGGQRPARHRTRAVRPGRAAPDGPPDGGLLLATG
jgi:hypothetical protein